MAQRYFLTGGLAPRGKEGAVRALVEQMLRVARVLKDEERDRLVAGTDFLAGLRCTGSWKLLVHARVFPIEALRAATVVPARVMKVADSHGIHRRGPRRRTW